MHNAQSIPICTITLNRVPGFGKVRIIYTKGVKKTWYNDGVIELSYDDIMKNNDFISIREYIN